MTIIQANWPAPANIKAFTVTEKITTPTEPILLTQTHGINVVPAITENIYIDADASYTRERNIVCAIRTADCLPVLICNKQGTLVSAIHAGWRGLVNGIIEETLIKLDSPPEDLLVWLGPAIGPEKFEVGKDVFDAFVSKDANASKAFNPTKPDKWLANLYLLAKIRLNNKGVTDIYGGEYCTFSDPERFFSYRRDKTTERLINLIWLE